MWSDDDEDEVGFAAGSEDEYGQAGSSGHKGKKDNGGGMLAEFCYDGWNGIHYFDVSAIVDPNDVDNVSEMWPQSDPSNTSGCKSFPCNNAYVLPDDIQTKTTKDSHIIVTLGMNGGGSKRDVPLNRVTRSYVLGGPY